MKIALASDHRGVDAVEALVEFLRAEGHETVVLGECGGASCDYPDQAYRVASAVRGGDARFGILVCGSGIGMSMSANKVRGVRAALVSEPAAAIASREHNDANVLCLSGDRSSRDDLHAIALAFLGARFEGGRHERRVKKMAAIERGEDPTAMTSDERAAPA